VLLLIQFFWEVFNHVLDVVNHINLDCTGDATVEVHCKAVVMFLALNCFDFTDAIIGMCFVEPLKKLIIDFGVHMARLQIIHMPCNSVLFASHCAICNTGFVRVDFEANSLDISSKLFVVEERGLKHSMDCSLHNQVENLLAILVGDCWAMQIWIQ